MATKADDGSLVPGAIIRRPELDALAGLDPASKEFRQGLNNQMTRRKELDELQELARVATRAALEDYEAIPDKWQGQLVLGTLFDGDDRIFELYVPGKRPVDAIVLTSARVNRLARTVSVNITNLQRRAQPRDE